MTSKGTSTYTWDYKDRLVAATLPGKQIEYLYNTSDRRIREIRNNKAVYYFYNGDKLLCEKLSQNRMLKIYINDDQGVLGMKRYSYAIPTEGFSGTQKLFYIFDELGSVVAITNADGMPLKYYIYDPWGNVVNTQDDPINNLTFVGRYGGLKDWDTGFVQFQHRWYDAEVGKWISRDPIGVEGGVNVYKYSRNSPINIIDSIGLGKEKEVDWDCVQKLLNETLLVSAGIAGAKIIIKTTTCAFFGPGALVCEVVALVGSAVEIGTTVGDTIVLTVKINKECICEK